MQHAIVTRLTLGRAFDNDLLQRIETDLFARMRENPEFLEFQVVEVSESDVFLLVRFASREALDEMSSTVAGPWFAEHVRPYLAGPVERSVGRVLCRSAPR